jgi:thiamine-monophosphate kinase
MAERRTPPGEFELIARHFAPLAQDFPGAFGLGDDTARFAVPPGHDLVCTTDTLVAGVHFLEDDPPELVARKALRVNLSDLAASGAEPLAYQLATAWPKAIDEAWIATFARGLATDQRAFGIALSGGDTVSTPGPLTITVTAFGTVPAGRGLGRSGARPGDSIMVSGTIGDGALGLLAARGALALKPKQIAFLADRYRLPQPRRELGPRLVGVASAAIDVSDGLVADLGHVCARSGCGAAIEFDRVPLSDAAAAALQVDAALSQRVLAGGDDYELLFAVPPERRAAALGLATTDVPVAEIGAFRSGSGVRVVRSDGSDMPIPAGGWQHF